MASENQNGFWAKVWEELQPILRHTIVVGVILLVFCAIALVFKGIQRYLPEQSEHLKWLEMMDVGLIYVLVLVFGLYAIAEVLIRSISGVMSVAREVFVRKGTRDSKEGLDATMESVGAEASSD